MRFRDLEDSTGHTPLVGLPRLSPRPGVALLAKLESYNPTGSVKDRVALSMVRAAEREGRLRAGSVLLEPTSGNTGIGLAMVAKLHGYRLVVVMPDNVTAERRQLLELFDAQIVLSDGREGSNGAIRLAQAMAQADDSYVMLFQYGNPANPDAHYLGTGQEIVEDCPEVDVFVAGLGTGGTLMGVARRLREHNPKIRVVAAEPQPGEDVQGLRSLEDGFVPPILDLRLLDAKVLVSNAEAVAWTRRLAMEEGIFAGLSAGANLAVAVREAERLESGSVVMIVPDGGWKYLSAGLWTRPMEALAVELENKVWW